MKVYLGPHKKWWGPYQIADLLQHIGVSEDRCHEIGERWSKTWLKTACEWVEARRGRKIKIRIDYYDCWSADHTLALIILPVLKLLKTKKHGSPHVDDEDAPEQLRSTAAGAKPEFDKDEGDTDGNWHARWSWVMDELIWSFDQIAGDEKDEPDISKDKAAWQAYQDRLDNGLRLFGKYYRGLWD